jgi:alanine racemase
MSAAAQLPRRCWAEVDLAALERNVRLIRAALPAHIRYVAVVKADAYGHGLPHVAARLMQSGADVLAVANLAEAAAIRELSADWPVLLLGAVLPEEVRHVAEYNLAAIVSSTEEVARFDAAARASGKAIAVHLKIDTGMGRLGVWFDRAPELHRAVTEARGLRLAGVFTHFASADDDPDFTDRQRGLFLRSLALFPGLDPSRVLIHADNSAGFETAPGIGPFNAVRIGLLQFGVLPHPHALLARVRTEPVLGFHARVGLVKTLPAGTGISYNRTHRLPRATRVAVITAGYGDGLMRSCSNRGAVLIRGQRCRILGRVCMDQTVVDLDSVPGEVAAGDQVTLIGRQDGAEITVAELSEWAGTVPWETFCAITKRVPRFYRATLGV